MLLTKTMMANIGISLLINSPSNAEKTPNPNEAPRDARNGKHMGQPIAETIVPREPTFSNNPGIFMVLILILKY